MRFIRTILLASVSFLGVAAAAPLAQARMVCTEVVDEAPPPLPEYDQPPIPGPGYVWTPGYWSYADDFGYYWVPGAWAQPPRPGLLWTPGYWGWRNGVFAFNPGYWGAVVGFYGGVNYGHGYGGAGYGAATGGAIISSTIARPTISAMFVCPMSMRSRSPSPMGLRSVITAAPAASRRRPHSRRSPPRARSTPRRPPSR